LVISAEFLSGSSIDKQAIRNVPSARSPASVSLSTPAGDETLPYGRRGTLTGSQMADGNTAEIFDGTVNGNQLSWKVSISDPMPLTLEFNGTIDGDE
jgi:hypothetical protein